LQIIYIYIRQFIVSAIIFASAILSTFQFLFQFLNTSGNVSIASNADAASFATSEETGAEEGETVEVDAITGATVTSKAIARSINSAVAVVTGADTASSATTWGG
jgi:hypothetical protein